ncbi:unnamed protein product [Blepharisma stoltei]|uniref:Uncharacterized protein n=1 Tax=Blepharisma stoltei TaxID=1481888 RepID=A0AAU9KDC3_9CILI|nr:unnamed protein product [Blepharisma stoltei]
MKLHQRIERSSPILPQSKIFCSLRSSVLSPGLIRDQNFSFPTLKKLRKIPCFNIEPRPKLSIENNFIVVKNHNAKELVRQSAPQSLKGRIFSRPPTAGGFSMTEPIREHNFSIKKRLKVNQYANLMSRILNN